jgi:hypothetical protein
MEVCYALLTFWLSKSTTTGIYRFISVDLLVYRYISVHIGTPAYTYIYANIYTNIYICIIFQASDASVIHIRARYLCQRRAGPPICTDIDCIHRYIPIYTEIYILICNLHTYSRSIPLPTPRRSADMYRYKHTIYTAERAIAVEAVLYITIYTGIPIYTDIYYRAGCWRRQ